MQQQITNEFSFILKPAQHGVGVFAVHDIAKGTFLRLFGKDEPTNKHPIRNLVKKDIPEYFQGYCIERGETMICPEDFGSMPVGWYLNHSNTPNAAHQDYNYYATQDIAEREEITIDYNTLEEPEENKLPYYQA